MTTQIVRTGPIAPVGRGSQAPPTIGVRLSRSTVVAIGALRVRPDRGRQFAVGEVLKGDRSTVGELATVVVPPFPTGDHRIVLMAARDEAGDLRLIGDPRHLDPASVTAAAADAAPSDGSAGP